MTTTPDGIEDLLQQAGVDIGKPEKRRARAVRLVSEGMTVEELETIIEWAHGSRRKAHTVGTWVSWVSDKAERWRDALATARRVRAEREAREPQQPNAMPSRVLSPEDSRRRLRGLAFCAVTADRRDPDQVAKELEVTRAELDELIAEERAWREQQRQEAEPIW